MALFDNVGRLYVAEILGPSWDRFGDRPNAQKALELFCGGYAYERAGASPDYAPAATQAIADTGRDPDPAVVWINFHSLVGEAVNPTVNPLWHRDKDCDCVLCVFRDDTGPRNIVSGPGAPSPTTGSRTPTLSCAGFGAWVESLPRSSSATSLCATESHPRRTAGYSSPWTCG
jgi:hypothetical protein